MPNLSPETLQALAVAIRLCAIFLVFIGALYAAENLEI